MKPKPIGELPSSLTCVRDTIHAARAWQPRDRGEDPRKVSRMLRAEADGLDRQAGFADDEGNRALACKCRAKAVSLRLRADSSPV